MTERQKFNIAENKNAIMSRDNYTCQKCGLKALFIAHRIAQTKSNISKYGLEIIHNPINLVSVCSNPKCNDSYNIGNNPYKCNKIVYLVHRHYNNEYSIDSKTIDEELAL